MFPPCAAVRWQRAAQINCKVSVRIPLGKGRRNPQRLYRFRKQFPLYLVFCVDNSVLFFDSIGSVATLHRHHGAFKAVWTTGFDSDRGNIAHVDSLCLHMHGMQVFRFSDHLPRQAARLFEAGHRRSPEPKATGGARYAIHDKARRPDRTVERHSTPESGSDEDWGRSAPVASRDCAAFCNGIDLAQTPRGGVQLMTAARRKATGGGLLKGKRSAGRAPQALRDCRC